MLGDRLKLARKRSGLSLPDLAERIGHDVSAQAISKYERGKMFPSSRVLLALAKALDVSLDFLMSDPRHPARTETPPPAQPKPQSHSSIAR